MKTISDEGLNLIKSFEGCHLTAYDDLQPKVNLAPSTKIKGTLTIGWGHTGNVKIGQTITQDEADTLLLKDLTKSISYVNNSAYVQFTDQLNQNQFDALVSFCFNCGQSNLKSLCNNRTVNQIPDKILLYNKSKGIVLPGLTRRRQAEKQLYEKAVDTVEQNNAKKIVDLENRINSLEEVVRTIITSLTKVTDKVAEIPTPDWFIQEFPESLNLVNQKTGTETFWRAFAVALRIYKS